MTHDEQIDHVRSMIEEQLRQADLDVSTFLGERLLLSDGHYFGRVFEWENAKASWFIEENQVKIFEASGRLLSSQCLDSQEAVNPMPAATTTISKAA